MKRLAVVATWHDFSDSKVAKGQVGTIVVSVSVRN